MNRVADVSHFRCWDLRALAISPTTRSLRLFVALISVLMLVSTFYICAAEGELDSGFHPLVSGAHPSDLTLANEPASMVAPGDSSSLHIIFDPSAPSLSNALANFGNNHNVEDSSDFTIGVRTALPVSSLTVGSTQTIPGTVVSIPINLDSIGTVTGISFTLSYDAESFSNPVIDKTSVSNSAQLLANGSVPGVINVAIAFLSGDTFASGNQELLILSLEVDAAAAKGDYSIGIGSSSTVFKIVDPTGNVLPSTSSDGIISVNNPPVATADSKSTDEDTAAIFDVLENDSDVDADTLTVDIVTPPSFGAAEVQTDQTLLYTPSANFHGSDSFTYTINDGLADSNEVTVDITVTSVDDPASLDPVEFSVNEDTSLVETVTANDIDGLTSGSLYSIASDPSHGSVSVVEATGMFTYIPDANFSSADSFDVRVTDDDGFTKDFTIAITVNSVPDNPTAVGDIFTTDEDQKLTILFTELIRNDFDVDGGTFFVNTASSDTASSRLVPITLKNGNSFEYDPTQVQSIIELEPGETLTDTFSYTIEDPEGNTGSGTVTITVFGVGYEGDLAGLTLNGVNYEDNLLDVIDFVQAGRFLVNLDTLGDSDRLFSSADTFPKGTGGNSVFDVSDWIQIARYIVGLDPLNKKNGPTNRDIFGGSFEDFPTGTPDSSNPNADSIEAVDIRISGDNLEAGKAGIVKLGVDSIGNFSSMGTTIEFDPTQMTYVKSSLVAGQIGSLRFIINDLEVDQGLLGILIASNPGKALPAGYHELIEIEFDISVDHNSGPVEISLSDATVRSAVSNRNAQKLDFALQNSTTNVRSITNFSQWAAIHETRSLKESGKIVVLAESEDSDGDGLSNAVEFVLGTNPMKENKIPLQTAFKEVNGQTVYEATTQVIIERGDVDVEVIPLNNELKETGALSRGTHQFESKFGKETRIFQFPVEQQSGFFMIRIRNKNPR